MRNLTLTTLTVLVSASYACAPATPMQQPISQPEPQQQFEDNVANLTPTSGQIYAIAAVEPYSPGEMGTAFISFLDANGKMQIPVGVVAVDAVTQAPLTVMPKGSPGKYAISIPATASHPFGVIVSAPSASLPAQIAFNIENSSYASKTFDNSQMLQLQQNLGALGTTLQGLRSVFPSCSSGTCPNPAAGTATAPAPAAN